MIALAKPEDIGIHPDRLEGAFGLMESWVHHYLIPGAGVAIGRSGKMLPVRVFGRHRPATDSPPMPDDAIFLVASITKPVTAVAVMLLVERGLLTLSDPVTRWVPEFGAAGKEAVTIRHLLTHTSGLPDMLSDNDALRARHAPLAEFIDHICRVPLAFPSGTQVQYQSMGIAMLSEIVRRITGRQCRDFLATEVFQPLEMHDTALGLPAAWRTGPKPKAARIAYVRIPEAAARTDWHWNTDYWWSFGAPWGGLLTTPADFARICQLFLNGGRLGKVRILSPATVKAMTTNQLGGMAQVPEENRRTKPWGLTWRLAWPGDSANFGDLLGPRMFGHWGATGTLCWIDPDADAYLILFTTQPQEPEGRLLACFSNAVAAALE